MRDTVPIFNKISNYYDFMNNIMSLGIHKKWKRSFATTVCSAHKSGIILDIGSGSGDTTYHFLQKYAIEDNTHCILIDPSEKMMHNAQKKLYQYKDKCSFILGKGENIPLDNESVSTVMMSFSLRNTQYRKTLQEVYRVLTKNGIFCCLEFSHPQDMYVRKIYHTYISQIIPLYGKFIAKDVDSYQYLVDSIKEFPHQEHLVSIFTEAGFSNSMYMNHSCGICTTHIGYKL